jgi:hypothetical protein
MSAVLSYGFRVDSRESGAPSRRRDSSTRRATSLAPSPMDVADRLLKKTVDDLLELRRLGNDWDGEGAIGPVPEIVDSAIDLINANKYGPPSRVVPVNDGRVSMEWYANGYFWSLRVDRPGHGRVMLVKPDGTTEFTEVSWSADRE